jgi:hypothetical protein
MVPDRAGARQQIQLGLKAKPDQWATETGRPSDELVEAAMAGYFDGLAQVRGMLNSRYDELESGRAQPIEGAPGVGETAMDE